MRLYDPIGGEHMNIMKAGLTNSHRIVAVSGEAGWLASWRVDWRVGWGGV
jgi:hypothetical protein